MQVVYFNEDQVTSSARDTARLICNRVESTTSTTTQSMPNIISYEIGNPGFDCAVGHVVSTHQECASSELISAVGIHFSNWMQTHTHQFGCLYSSSLHALFFNYYQGGSVDYNYSPVCKTESNPVIRNFNVGSYDTNVCASGEPIADPELCREAAAILGEAWSLENRKITRKTQHPFATLLPPSGLQFTDIHRFVCYGRHMGCTKIMDPLRMRTIIKLFRHVFRLVLRGFNSSY